LEEELLSDNKPTTVVQLAVWAVIIIVVVLMCLSAIVGVYIGLRRQREHSVSAKKLTVAKKAFDARLSLGERCTKEQKPLPLNMLEITLREAARMNTLNDALQREVDEMTHDMSRNSMDGRSFDTSKSRFLDLSRSKTLVKVHSGDVLKNQDDVYKMQVATSCDKTQDAIQDPATILNSTCSTIEEDDRDETITRKSEGDVTLVESFIAEDTAVVPEGAQDEVAGMEWRDASHELLQSPDAVVPWFSPPPPLDDSTITDKRRRYYV